MKNYLYFAHAAPDGGAGDEEVLMIEQNNISHFEVATDDGTDGVIQIWGKEGVGQEAQADGVDNVLVRLTYTSGKHKEVLTDIAGALTVADTAYGGFVVVADKENGIWLSPHLNNVAIVVVDAS